MVYIDAMPFGFMPDRGIIDAIFIARQIQEKYLAQKKPLLTLRRPLIESKGKMSGGPYRV